MDEQDKTRLLLIIDPQIDFITGSLPVPGAADAMDSLAEYIRRSGRDYSHVILTADRHPRRHCSFRSEGGEWPEHCVADSTGAAIWPALMEALLEIPDKVIILHKGENADTEEYSILKNREAAGKILSIVNNEGIEQADICGLAGDFCVADSIRDWMKSAGNVRLNILKEFTPSIDGGKTLDSLISKFGLPCTR